EEPSHGRLSWEGTAAVGGSNTKRGGSLSGCPGESSRRQLGSVWCSSCGLPVFVPSCFTSEEPRKHQGTMTSQAWTPLDIGCDVPSQLSTGSETRSAFWRILGSGRDDGCSYLCLVYSG